MSTSMNMKYLNLFMVPIQINKLELNIDSLIEFCYEMKRENEKGVKLTNIGGWHSDNIINETHTEVVKLKNKIEEAANVYHYDIRLKKTYNQKLDNIWININQKGHSNVYHDHPHSILSGTFYLTKGASAPIVFQHPFREISIHYWHHSILEEVSDITSSERSISPEPNTLLIFPPWVKHKVSMNEENIDRISFSFNTSIYEKE
jgi:uncharacterized protein (TIGR02466 family)